MQQKNINTEYIKLEQFLKLVRAADTGGAAKAMILSGEIKVNGETEIRRGRKLYPGDKVAVGARTFIVG